LRFDTLSIALSYGIRPIASGNFIIDIFGHEITTSKRIRILYEFNKNAAFLAHFGSWMYHFSTFVTSWDILKMVVSLGIFLKNKIQN
jgi:hypothetical protein